MVTYPLANPFALVGRSTTSAAEEAKAEMADERQAAEDVVKDSNEQDPNLDSDSNDNSDFQSGDDEEKRG